MTTPRFKENPHSRAGRLALGKPHIYWSKYRGGWSVKTGNHRDYVFCVSQDRRWTPRDIVTDRKYRVRCRKCRARQTINKHPDAYVRPKRCWSCRSTELVVDKYRDTKREARRQTCTCDGTWYPHRRGNVEWCEGR